MRLLDTITDQGHAERFGDYLLTQGIRNSVEEGVSGWLVWVEDDDHLDRARQELVAYRQRPDDPRYDRTGDARKIRNTEEKQDKRLRANYVDVRTRWSGLGRGDSPLTVILVVACVLVALGTRLGTDQYGYVMYWLLFEPVTFPDPQRVVWQPWSNVMTGQVWRLITPIFIHFGPWHLVFNLLWLLDLGAAIERQRGLLTLLTLVVVGGVASNCLEYMYDLGYPEFFGAEMSPFFGGMSGVVYTLFGYVWMKGKYQPYLGLGVAPQTTQIMLGWLLLCMTGLLGSIANVAHLVGLTVGVAIGYLPLLARKFRP